MKQVFYSFGIEPDASFMIWQTSKLVSCLDKSSIFSTRSLQKSADQFEAAAWSSVLPYSSAYCWFQLSLQFFFWIIDFLRQGFQTNVDVFGHGAVLGIRSDSEQLEARTMRARIQGWQRSIVQNQHSYGTDGHTRDNTLYNFSLMMKDILHLYLLIIDLA